MTPSPQPNQIAEMPWSDCKVAFGYEGDEDDLWQMFGDGYCQDPLLPAGWEMNETDAAGARLVVIFRVNGTLRVEDGEQVATLLREAASKARAGEVGHD